MSVLGTDISMLLRNDHQAAHTVGSVDESSTPAPRFDTPRTPVDKGESTQRLLEPLANVPATAAQLHPVELGMDPADREHWARLYPQFFDYYKRTKFGPE
jgi:hypothetical protein